MLEKFRVVDLFCGCGGLSRGFERTGRFRTIFGLDIHPSSMATFKANHGTDIDGGPETFLGDINDLSIDSLWSRLERFGVRAPGDLECLVGGPPCEGFSRNKVYSGDDGGADTVPDKTYQEAKYWQQAWKAAAGSLDPARRSRAYNPFLADPRNFLFRAFLAVAKELRPKIILIENVREILAHNDGAIKTEILETLDAMGYEADARVLHAVEYGVPQFRVRAFIIAFRRTLDPDPSSLWPERTHSAPLEDEEETLLPGDRGWHVTTREAMADLPDAAPERVGSRQRPASEYPDVELSWFRRWVRSVSNTPDNNVYRTPSEGVIAKLRAMQPGMKAHDLPTELQPKKYYYNAYGRLEWHRPANTITKSFIYPGSGKFGHPATPRVLSYREAARLQSFDDDFGFIASSQEGFSHMIGSAVPPLLGYRFAERFAELLDRGAVVPAEAAPARKRGTRERRVAITGK